MESIGKNQAAERHQSKDSKVWNTVKGDYKEFYYPYRLLRMGIAFCAGAIVANTSVDENLQSRYQDHVRSSNTDNIAKAAKQFGEGKYLISLSLLSAWIGSCLNDGETSPIGIWGQRTARAYLVGGPAVLLMQRVTGASRPGESSNGSDWDFLNDDNGVSGHAFIGAVPFLTIAHMNEENKPLKYLLYAASTLTALSRINDNAHYPSQAALGWYLAWEASDTIFEKDKEQEKITVEPWITGNCCGVLFRVKW